MIRKIKLYLYESMVNYNRNVKRYYELYKTNHQEYHKKHPLKSYIYLRKLQKYFNRGAVGNFPANPCDQNSQLQIPVDASIEWDNLSSSEAINIIKNSAYFDEKWYLKTYKDVAKTHMDPAKHYLTIGWREFRRPGPSFSSLLYLNRYADASALGINPLLHYELIGKKEKRVSSYQELYKKIAKEIQLIEKSKFFDSKWYKNKYLKEDVTCEKPSVHYFCIGHYWNYAPSAAFSNELYKKEFPELNNLPYLLHYETYSKKHGKGYFNLSTEYYGNSVLYAKIINSMFVAMLQLQFHVDQPKVLLISHTLNATGAPAVLAEMAFILKNHGFFPVIMTINEGPIMQKLEKENIPVVISRPYENPQLFDNIRHFSQMFDFIVFSTIESMKFAHVLKYTRAYKIAWVHEGEETLKLISYKQKDRINLMDEIYTGSAYCNDYFAPYINNQEKMGLLLYGIDEDSVNIVDENTIDKKEKIIFVVAGTIGYRKGHHILAEAIYNLPNDILSEIEIWIVGAVIDEEVGKEIALLSENHSCIRLFGQVSNERLNEIIAMADVLLCPSIDDPLPVVVTNAFILKKPVIVTDMVGTSHFIENEKNGFVIKSKSSEDLIDIISKIVIDKPDLKEIGQKGYEIYKSNLSYDVFEEKIVQIFDTNKIKDANAIESRTITNEITFLDLQISTTDYIFVFSCDIDNELCIVLDDVIYEEATINDEKWECLNKYLIKENKRVAIILVHKANLLDSRLMVASQKMDTIDLKIGEYTWLSLNKLARQNFCIWINENVLSFITRNDYYMKVINNSKLPIGDIETIKKAANIKEYKYNIYCETRDNMNDNAFQLFLYDLKTNSNAYFLTTLDNYEKEMDEEIKNHLLVLNSAKAKDYMLQAKRIISSWYAPPIFGYKKMLLLYPFLNLNYIFVPHGISYDKDSYYLNTALWGEFTKTICSSDVEKRYFENCNGYKNVKVLGYPRMDKWFNSEINDKMVVIFPSYRKYIDEHYINTIVDLCQGITNNLPDWQIVYLAHPSIEKNDYSIITKKIKKISSKIIIGSCDERNVFNEYFGKAKFLITDYSSVAYDFAYKLGVSIYYDPFIDDNVQYHMNDLFYDYNCGFNSKSVEEVINILQGNYSEQLLNEKVKRFFPYRDCCNTERVYNEIMFND